MPQKNNKKEKKIALRRKFFTYSPQQVQNALDSIRSGTSISIASKNFDPRTTLKRKKVLYQKIWDAQTLFQSLILT